MSPGCRAPGICGLDELVELLGEVLGLLAAEDDGAELGVPVGVVTEPGVLTGPADGADLPPPRVISEITITPTAPAATPMPIFAPRLERGPAPGPSE